MKVIYETYRRHRNNSSSKNNNNNNGHHAGGTTGNTVEICHPNDLLSSSSSSFNAQSNMTNNNNIGSHDYPPDAAFPVASGDGSSSIVRSSSGCHQPRHIISADSLLINKELGIGEFGVVQQGVWTNAEGQRIQVAIKCLSAARLENSRLEFLKEATIMHTIAHEHIVTLYGVVLEPSIMLITELAPLRSLLECLKEPALASHFPLTSLCTFATQIADGMAYLESKRLIHRDLAARNILVFSKTKVKISDFGLSRALGVGKDYYQSNFNVNLKLPIAWCAPECINYLKFTSQSDVWAYGVTLWEMFSFGFQPWAALTGQQILEAIDKPNYQRLEKPECCPKEYYQLMLKCWNHEPNMRPKFSEIVTLLPDCKPELLQAIRNSGEMNRKDYLSYKTGDIVTVVDKNYELIEGTKESLWKGVTNDRKTGTFNPSDFVAYLGQNLPSSNNSSNYSSTSFVQQLLSGSSSNGNHHSSLASTITSTVLQSSKFLRGFLESKSHHHHSNNNSSPHGSRKTRLRPDMISRPQGDFKHTGHVGADGVFFGDVSFLEGKYHSVPSKNHSDVIESGNGNGNTRKLTISNPMPTSFNSTGSYVDKSMNNYCNSNHEYHEISDEEDGGPLESPPFEVLDFGPSLMEEVFRELDHIKPDLNNEAGENETAINENSINVKNEVHELNLKLAKENNNLKKKQSAVKPISEAEQNELDSAIAMAKDIANRTMLEDDLDLTKNDSPKTPNSPNKRKFSFKFPTHRSPKSDRKTFSEETESIGNIIESITPAAKEAYKSLVDKCVNSNKEPSQPPSPTMTTSYNSALSHEINIENNNPLRMLRTAGIGNVLRPKVRGNRSFSQPRLPTTAQTAGLARVASSRSPLGLNPALANCDQDQSMMPVQSQQANLMANNALPLPPRDRSRPLIQLKTHQRRHPLVIPTDLATSTATGASLTAAAAVQNNHIHETSLSEHLGFGGATGTAMTAAKNMDMDGSLDKPMMMTMNSNGKHHESFPLVHRHVPVLKQVSCPQAPAAFLSIYNKTANGTNNGKSNGLECDNMKGGAQSNPGAPAPPPKPNQIYLSDDLTESLENEIQKAFDNIKIQSQYSNDSIFAPKTTVHQVTVPPAPVVINNVCQNEKKPISDQVVVNQKSFQPEIFETDKKLERAKSDLSSSTTLSTSKLVDHQIEARKRSTISSRRNIDSDEVRVMQKVLTNEVNLTAEECTRILDSTDWDIHKAIKCIRLRQQLRNHNIQVECDWSQMLSKFNWNIRQASNYLIATQGVPEDTTEV